MPEIELLIPIVTAIVAALSSISAFVKFARDTSKRTEIAEHQQDVISSEVERKQQEETQLNVIQSIAAQLTKLEKFYTLNKDQAALSFNASMAVMILGFLTIASGIWLFFLKQPSNIALSTITVISGVLCDFIGASYFIMYRMNITQMNYYFRQLVALQDTMLTIKLVKDLCQEGSPHETKKIEMTEKIVVALLKRSSNLAQASLTPIDEVNTTETRNASGKPINNGRVHKPTATR